MILYLLCECAAGYALFEKQEFDEINTQLIQIQKQITKMELFSTVVRLKAFLPFASAEIALRNMLSIKNQELSEELQNFLEQNLPTKKKKKNAFCLAVQDNKLAGVIAQTFAVECKTSEVTFELFRGIRQHFTTFIKNKDFKETDLQRAQLGLAHAYSRNQVEFDTKRQDKPIIMTGAIIEQLDKGLNTFSMRLKEWFSWHFPELTKIVPDNEIFCRIVYLVQNRSFINDGLLGQLEEITKDAEIAQQIVEASNNSMGQDLSEIDNKSINEFADKVVKSYDFKKNIYSYQKDRLNQVAPNLTALVGESVASKLITQAGSLMTLAKYPASTVQILGAEKALFRALKQKTNTPKYGLLYHSGFISRAAAKDKGKISRYLANKCSIASRIDQFLVKPSNKFGEKMKVQVEDRLKFLTSGEGTNKNLDVMNEVLEELKQENLYIDTEQKQKKKKKSKKIVEEIQEEIQEQPKKKKKSKKISVEVLEEEVEELAIVKKKKKVKTA